MKKTVLLMAFLALIQIAFGQKLQTNKQEKESSKSELLKTDETLYPKKPLIEVFTSSTCPPCASYNPVLAGILLNYIGEYSLIKYQMNWPGTGDPYYTIAGGNRRYFYGVTGVPSVYSNGNFGYIESNSQFESLTTAQSAFKLEITYAEINGTKVLVETSVNSLVGQKAGLKYHVVLVEKQTIGNRSTNGEMSFQNVMMNILENGYGITLDTLIANVSQAFSHEFEMAGTNVEELKDLGIVIFVQNELTKGVMQSEMAFNIHLVGLQENNEPSFDMYPSPSAGTFQMNHIESADVKIFNLSGQLMRTFTNVTENQVIDISELPNGTYMIQVKDKNLTAVKKLLIAK